VEPKSAAFGSVSADAAARLPGQASRSGTPCPWAASGTGSLWLNGHGRLSVWQIFNNLSEPRIPDSFFAVAARAGKGEAVTRVLQTSEREIAGNRSSVELRRGLSNRAIGISRIRRCRLKCRLEAMNPMIPLERAEFVRSPALYSG